MYHTCRQNTVECQSSKHYSDKRIKVHLHSFLEKSLSPLDNRWCLSAKAFKFQANLVTMSSIKRKRNVVTPETKLQTIDQLAIEVRVSFLACTTIFLLLLDYANHPWSQPVWIIGILYCNHIPCWDAKCENLYQTILQYPEGHDSSRAATALLARLETKQRD